MRRGVLLCCDITSTIRRLYDPYSKVYDALRAENSRKMKERWKDDKFRAKVIKGMVRAWKLHYLISRRSRAHVTRQRLHLSRAHVEVFITLSRVGLKDHLASAAGDATRQKLSESAPRRSGAIVDDFTCDVA